MLNLTSDKTQYALVPLTFRDQNGPRTLPFGSLKAEVVSGDGATAEVLETAVDGVPSFSLKLVTGPTAGLYRFRVVDNTPDGDNLRINTLDVDYVTSEESLVEIEAGTAEFRPKTEITPVP